MGRLQNGQRQCAAGDPLLAESQSARRNSAWTERRNSGRVAARPSQDGQCQKIPLPDNLFSSPAWHFGQVSMLFFILRCSF